MIAGVDDKGPAKPAGIEPGDVVVKFDGKDIKEPKDLSRVVADTAVGKEVDVVIIRKGEEETSKVTLGRLEDSDKAQQAAAKTKDEPRRKAGDAEGARPRSRRRSARICAAATRSRTASRAWSSPASTAPPTPPRSGSAAGDVIVEVAQEAVSNAADIKKRVDQLKKDGKKSVLLLVANADGELRFVALSVQ